MQHYPGSIKRMLRKYATEAYEKELHRELSKLERHFEAWKTGTISSGEFSHLIHQYERGPLRELYKKYNYGEDALNVAGAVVTGLLDREQLPAELLEAIQDLITAFQSMRNRDNQKGPDTD